MNPMSGNYARIVESVRYEDITANEMYAGLITLDSYHRAKDVATNFQWYRITEVKYTFEPIYDTFQEALAGTANPAVPQFVYIMNRDGTFLAGSVDDLYAQGAKPTKFIKNKIIKYKPNTLVQNTPSGTDGVAPTLNGLNAIKFNSWIPTQTLAGSGVDPFALPYYGMQFYVAQDNVLTPTVCKLNIEIVVEFKQPAYTTTLQALKSLKPLTVAV